jgi:hypothetical protein
VKSLADNSTLIHQLPTDIQHVVLQAFVNSFHVDFLRSSANNSARFLLALMLKEVPLRTNEDYEQAKEEAAGKTLG